MFIHYPLSERSGREDRLDSRAGRIGSGHYPIEERLRWVIQKCAIVLARDSPGKEIIVETRETDERSHGATPRIDSDRSSPLQIILLENRLETIKDFLLKVGIDIEDEVLSGDWLDDARGSDGSFRSAR
jgi:hypothetical protein